METILFYAAVLFLFLIPLFLFQIAERFLQKKNCLALVLLISIGNVVIFLALYFGIT
jgi:ABC-type protease/lipase transport system fused ATPase/permease subunit